MEPVTKMKLRLERNLSNTRRRICANVEQISGDLNGCRNIRSTSCVSPDESSLDEDCARRLKPERQHRTQPVTRRYGVDPDGGHIPIKFD